MTPSTSTGKSILRPALTVLGILLLLAFVLVGIYAGNVFAGMRAAAQTSGTIAGTGVVQPVEILRDGRDIPHIRARSLHDLFYAQGFAEGSDRLFQMDLVRRFVYGRLAEVLGARLLPVDERARVVDVRGIVDREWQNLDPRERAILQAFSDGVNAAMAREPLPVEFRLLLYTPQPWRPQDSLAAGFATVLDLTDSWRDVLDRNQIWRTGNRRAFDAAYPLTDWKYDAPTVGRDAPRSVAASLPAEALAALVAPAAGAVAHRARRGLGSNDWAAGAAHTATGRALLANDPHLDLYIPGIWYLVDLRAPGFHVAGAAIAGTPGVILGHNDHIAWGVTNGTVAALSVFDAPANLPQRNWVTETFHVRFGGDVTRRYYRGRREFGVPRPRNPHRIALVRWSAYTRPYSPVAAFLDLDAANSVRAALHALARYPGPTQNFVVAGTSGRVAYQLAGEIPDDPAWARYVHPASDLRKTYPDIPFARLPHVAPSKRAVVFTANDKMYGAGYPYRLSASFEAPYRAYRISRLLRARKTYDVSYFARMQRDTLSPADLEFARDVVRAARAHPRSLPPSAKPLIDALATWDGRFDPSSVGATVERAVRTQALYDAPSFVGLLGSLRQDSGGRLAAVQHSVLRAVAKLARAPAAPRALLQPWRLAGAVRVKHQLASMGFTFLDGALLPGDGEKYTVHVQMPKYSQSFRAVWDIGNWNAGGIVIPSGESGEPGSGHYTDLSRTWIANRLVPLPYGTRAVDAAARATLTLKP